MADRIHVGFIGCGRIADLHALGYVGHPDARLFGVCDTDSATVTRRQKEWGAEATYTDYRSMLADPRVHAVEILTPQVLHERMVIEALEAGKHVAVQKPMTVDLASADRMIRAARRSGRVFKVTENYVFYPPLVRARQLIRDGVIGEPRGLRIKMLGGPSGGWEVPASAWEWRVEEMAAGRGFTTFDHGHHLWSTAWFLLGESERVVAWIDSADGVVDCPASVMWRYRDGVCHGVCDLHHAQELRVPSKYYSNDEWMEITGDAGVLFLRRCTGLVHEGPILSRFDGREWHHEDDLDSDWAAGFVGATHNFIDAIRGRAEPMLDGAQGREILRFTLAVARSAKWRREVTLEELESAVPALYAVGRRYRELWTRHGAPVMARLLGGSTTRFATRAVELTEALVAGYDAEAAKGVSTVIGLHLTPDGGVEERFGLRVADGEVRLERGAIPEDARLIVWMPAGLWAAILLKERRIETALFQRKITFEGRAEEALKLREVFDL